MSEIRPRVLVVDGDEVVRAVVCAQLRDAGYTTHEAVDGREALDLAARIDPDLIVLDVVLPEVDGFTVLSRLRARTDVPVILLTARTDEIDRVVGLGLGADDYVLKPFSPTELTARVRTVLRRSAGQRQPDTDEPLRFDDLGIDAGCREVTVGDEAVVLTAREFDLLAFLASSPSQVFSRGQLLHQVWDSSTDRQDPSTVTVHIQRLRRKIEHDPKHPRHIATVWGVGYRFDP